MKYFFVVIVSSLMITSAIAQGDWDLKKEKKGIKIYTRVVDDSNFKEFKGVTEINASVSSIVAVLMDIENYTEWSPKTAEAKVLERNGSTELIDYIKTNAPWPVSDRDGIYTMKIEKAGNKVLVKVGCKPDYLPENKGVVRIRQTKGGWELTPLANGNTKVKYQVHSEPGGSVPAWLANSSVVDIPYESLTHLKEQVRKPTYRNASLEFLQ